MHRTTLKQNTKTMVFGS